MPRLIIERPGAPPRLYELKDGSTIHIGRAASNDITLPHSSISRTHALLEGKHDVWMVTDQHSANGVLLNGVRIDRAELKSGDVIGLGDIKLRFEDPAWPGWPGLGGHSAIPDGSRQVAD